MFDLLEKHPDLWMNASFWIVGSAATFIAVKAGHFIWGKLTSAYRAFEGHFEDVKSIKKQVLPNGGTSLPDKVDKLVQAQAVQSEHLNKMSLRGAVVEAIVKSASWDTSTIPQFITDTEGDVVDVNRAFIDLTSRGMDLMGNGGGINVVVSEDRTRVDVAWKQAVAEQRDFEDVFRIKTPTGFASVSCRAIANFDRAATDKPFIGHAGRFRVLDQVPPMPL